MSRILNKIINYGLFFIFILIINSCAHFKIIDLEKNTSTPNSFFDFLSLEYLEFAKYELYEMHDEFDANYFAYKSSLAINEKKFYPENPKDWDVPSNYMKKANSMYSKINNLINQNVYSKFPEKFSKMIAGYDCWIEQVEENWQFNDIEQCFKKFDKNFKFISENYASNQQKMSKRTKTNNNKTFYIEENDNKNIEVYKVVVFFEFDKFTLSSNQVIELENFIKTAKENSKMKILIEGHTDTMGSNFYNTKLSIKRANFIKKYLIDRNLNNTMETKAYGEANLLVETNDQIKQKLNRRAELYLK